MIELAENTSGQIDVVIPTFNRLWALRHVAEFYLRMGEVGRLIIVNDCSTDDTTAWLTGEAVREPRLVHVQHDVNRGASAARNTGAGVSQAPFVFFADDDMIFTPVDGLARMKKEMISHHADIAAPIHIVPENSSFSGLPRLSLLSSWTPPLLFSRLTLELRSRSVLARYAFPSSFVTPFACGLMLMRRHVLDKVRYDDGLGTTSYRDETDFQLKAKRLGFRLIACVRPVLIDLARGKDDGGCHASVTPMEYELKAWRNNWRILRRHQDVIRNQLGIRAPIVCLQAFFVARHAVNRLARHYLGQLLRACGVIRRTR